MSYVAVGVGVASLAYGVYNSESQKAQAKKLARTQRPAYQTNPYLEQYLKNTRQRANTYGLPGQGAIENQLNKKSAFALQSAKQSQQGAPALAATAAAIDQNTKDTTAQLGVEGAKYQAGQQSAYDNALMQGAGEFRDKWQWENASPYLNAMAAAAKLNAASDQNMNSAINIGAQTALTASQNYNGTNRTTDPLSGTTDYSWDNRTGYNNTFNNPQTTSNYMNGNTGNMTPQQQQDYFEYLQWKQSNGYQ